MTWINTHLVTRPTKAAHAHSPTAGTKYPRLCCKPEFLELDGTFQP